jgi:hypothetical protein
LEQPANENRPNRSPGGIRSLVSRLRARIGNERSVLSGIGEASRVPFMGLIDDGVNVGLKTLSQS